MRKKEKKGRKEKSQIKVNLFFYAKFTAGSEVILGQLCSMDFPVIQFTLMCWLFRLNLRPPP